MSKKNPSEKEENFDVVFTCSEISGLQELILALVLEVQSGHNDLQYIYPRGFNSNIPMSLHIMPSNTRSFQNNSIPVSKPACERI